MRKLTALLLLTFAATLSAADAAAPRKPWLGMALTLRQGPDGAKFVYVAVVPEGTPAGKAGMAAGDVVTAINGKKIAFRDDLDVMEFVGAFKPGETIRFHVVRSGKTKIVAVKAGELPREYEEALRESLERAREMRKRAETKAQ
ncbi:MAG: serine protease Do [Acidobacteriota bacterium]|jgi:S1-C subfamily serine protease|nr:serine protease Do [Acidobacteriota bacterium]